MKNNEKLTIRQEKFIRFILDGYSLKDAYEKAFPNSYSNPNTIYCKASLLFNQENIHNRYIELRELIEKELQEKSVWSKERAINELKNLLNRNIKEAERYEVAYNDEIEILNKQIIERENEINNSKKYLSKKKKELLMNEIDSLKMARIKCNRRWQSNRTVNEAILNSILQINTMLGFDRIKEEKLPIDAQVQINFTDDVTNI